VRGERVFERAAAPRQLEGLRERGPHLVAVDDPLVAQRILEGEDGEPDLREEGGEAWRDGAELIEVGAEGQHEGVEVQLERLLGGGGRRGRRRRAPTASDEADEGTCCEGGER